MALLQRLMGRVRGALTVKASSICAKNADGDLFVTKLGRDTSDDDRVNIRARVVDGDLTLVGVHRANLHVVEGRRWRRRWRRRGGVRRLDHQQGQRLSRVGELSIAACVLLNEDLCAAIGHR